MDMNKRKKGITDEFKVFGLSNWKGKTAITEMVRSIKGTGLAGKIKTYFVFNMLSRRCVSHIQVQLSRCLELGEVQAGDRHSRAVSLPTCKTVSLALAESGKSIDSGQGHIP